MTYKFEKTLTLYIETDSKENAEEYIKNLEDFPLDVSDVANDLLANNFEAMDPKDKIEDSWIKSSNWRTA